MPRRDRSISERRLSKFKLFIDKLNINFEIVDDSFFNIIEFIDKAQEKRNIENDDDDKKKNINKSKRIIGPSL